MTERTYPAGAARRMLMIAAISHLVIACALVYPPTAQLEVTRRAVAEAEASGASERAPIELEEARGKLARAEERVRRGDYVGAERWAEAAEADARLAAMRARAAAAEEGLHTTGSAGESPAGSR